MKEETTYGERAVNLSYSVSDDSEIAVCRKNFAVVIDQLHKQLTDVINNNPKRMSEADYETIRLLNVAITEAQGAHLWAMKALTAKWKVDVYNGGNR